MKEIRKDPVLNQTHQAHHTSKRHQPIKQDHQLKGAETNDESTEINTF